MARAEMPRRPMPAPPSPISGRYMRLKDHIRQIPDFPKPGILFYDISTLLAHAEAWRATVEQLSDLVRPHRPDMLVSIESRGFLVAAPLAYSLGCGFAMVRKKGKLPGATLPYTYDLEYGKDSLEMHADAIVKGQRVLVVDDVLATGGTMKAACDLVRHLGGSLVGVAVLIELTGLNGRSKLGEMPVHSVLQY